MSSSETVLVKISGSVAGDSEALRLVAKNVVELRSKGFSLIIVHGGGPQINNALAQADLSPEFVDGMRVTNDETFRLVRSALHDVSQNVCANINTIENCSVAMSGDDGVFTADLLDPKLGLVGKIIDVNSSRFRRLLDSQVVPVVNCLASGLNGKSLNINADWAAAAIASALEIRRVVFLTNVDGVFLDFSDANSLLDKVGVRKLAQLLDAGCFNEGMKPKVQSCIQLIEQGVEQVHLVNGLTHNSLLDAVNGAESLGTLVAKDQVNEKV